MVKSILVIDTQDLKDIFGTLNVNELYLEIRTLAQSITNKDTTELLEYVDLMYNGTPIEKRLARHKLNKALGGQDG